MNRETVREHIEKLKDKAASLEAESDEFRAKAENNLLAVAVLREEISDLEEMIAPKIGARSGGGK